MAPIYLINLARRPDRLALMTGRLKRAGLAFTRIDAIDARGADPAWLGAQFAPPGRFGPLTPAEQACALSHFKAFEAFASSPGSATHTVILEDDARLADDAGSLLACLDWLPPSTRLLKIERERPLVLLGARKRVGGPGGPVIARLHSDHSGSAGYIISRALAAELARLRLKPSLMIDYLLFHPSHSPIFRHLKPDQLVPALVEQSMPGSADSDIESSRAALLQGRSKPFAVSAKLRRELARLRNQARALTPVGLGGARWTGLDDLSVETNAPDAA